MNAPLYSITACSRSQRTQGAANEGASETLLMNVTRSRRLHIRALLTSLTSALLIAGSVANAGSNDIEWPSYGGNLGFNRYSSANLINKQSVQKLRVLWTRPAVDE